MAGDRRKVVVIGAGIVGVSTAIELHRAGHDVTLIDRGAPGDGTSYGNAGLLASCAIVPVTVPGVVAKAPKMLLGRDQPLYLRWSYLPRLLPWLARYLSHATGPETRRIAAALMPLIGDSLADHQALAEGTGAERYVVPSDYLYVYRSRAEYEADALTWDIRRAHGFRWTEMEREALAAHDPVFAPLLGFAARIGNHGRISDPGAYVKALARHLEAQGGRVLKAEVSNIARAEGRVTGVRAGGETIACDTAVLTTGAWSGPLARALGLRIPLETERGYHIELWEPSAMPRAPSMIAAGKFVATPMEGRLRLAGVVEFGGLEAGPSRAPFEMLRRSLQAAMPGITWAECTEWMGHRPATTDSLPVIGPAPGVAGAWVGFGHQHVGLTGGPKTGRLLAQMISGQSPNIDMVPYAADRFG
ncbi:FAD-dependent oxidoreductase [Maritimibacter sp. 55A14]|uniref:NAD(P)/FAD-dependent oxidoreductase n=1 Tax=Maritimibacter sp. 55A14 TaxID=2174844 RepID=UPI000D6173FC|nr:FAD-dependent oxidoreductase [Maritimibacter sp. 55A14]PWE33887.1 FAD-dependent oxidoreductase [Maritimibacter sp. 55A14]